MKYSIKYWLLLALLFSLKGFSQEVPKGFELMEIVKISETYRLASDISFDMSITYADSTQPNTILEQLQGQNKIHNGKYWGTLDSIEYLQGSMYNLAVYRSDSMITVSNRQEYSKVLQIPLMDSLFRDANIADIQVTRVNDSTRSLKIIFNPESVYHSYGIQYDLNSFLIRNVKYYLTGADRSGDVSSSSGVDCVNIIFSNYSDEVVDEEYFNEGKFIYNQGGQLLPQSAFAGFKVMISGTNQNQ